MTIRRMAEESPAAETPVRVSVTLGEHAYAPVQYHVFKVGPFFASRSLKPGETIAEAMMDLTKELEQFAAQVYQRELKAFLERMRTARNSVAR